uniref:Uncharacterized protein n=1 Tax=Octopus bimaculoides TaxID=37653 RepID=A0A0L8H6W5_OCTBM
MHKELFVLHTHTHTKYSCSFQHTGAIPYAEIHGELESTNNKRVLDNLPSPTLTDCNDSSVSDLIVSNFKNSTIELCTLTVKSNI